MKLPLGTLLVTPRGVIVLLEAGFEITRFVEHTVKKSNIKLNQFGKEKDIL